MEKTEKIDNEALNDLCSQVSLLDYANTTMDFKKRGSDSYTCSCPLHVDKTPSLFITPSQNLFYCQSCGVGGNLINWLMTFENLSFMQAVNKLVDLTGTDLHNIKISNSMKIYKELKHALSGNNKKIVTEREVLNHSYLDQFADEAPEEWLEEGISAPTMKKFGIRVDHMANRIIYPVYSEDFKLIGVKGRTRFSNYKDLNIKKYQNYQKIGTTNYFAGMKENYDSILRSNSAIIFEGIKSVMKLYDWGWSNAIATETSGINDYQVLILVKMGIREVTFADDNDIPLSNIIKYTQKLRRYMNVYAVHDTKNLLPENKMSPCDAGKDIWEQLYKERIKL